MPNNKLTEVWLGFQIQGCQSSNDVDVDYEDLSLPLQMAYLLNLKLQEEGLSEAESNLLENSICNWLKKSLQVNLETSDIFEYYDSKTKEVIRLNTNLPSMHIERFEVSSFYYPENSTIPSFVSVTGLISLPWQRISSNVVKLGSLELEVVESCEEWMEERSRDVSSLISVSYSSDEDCSDKFEQCSFLDEFDSAQSWFLSQEDAMELMINSNYALEIEDFII